MRKEEMAKKLGELIEWLDVEIVEVRKIINQEKEYQARVTEKEARTA